MNIPGVKEQKWEPKNTRWHSEKEKNTTHARTHCFVENLQIHRHSLKTNKALFQFDLKKDMSNHHHYQTTTH
jgi:hypothetical protein